jgi:hypothetical protein
VRTLIASLACAAALLVAAVPAGASPIDGRPNPRYTPSLQPTSQPEVVHELHTVIRERDAGRTLAFVLSGAALLIAGGTAAWTIVLMSRRRSARQVS